jgi:predicted membrane GTPase involved in stress response
VLAKDGGTVAGYALEMLRERGAMFSELGPPQPYRGQGIFPHSPWCRLGLGVDVSC